MRDSADIFSPTFFRSGVSDKEELTAQQLNLLYARVCRRDNQAHKEALVSLAITMQQEALDAEFLDDVYNTASDEDGIWINEEQFFALLKKMNLLNS